MGIVEILANALKVEPAGIRLLIGLLLAFPLMSIYKSSLLTLPRASSKKHAFMWASGLLISFFCFGSYSLFLCVAICLSWLTLRISKLLRLWRHAALFNFAVSFTYFLACMYFYCTDGYDILFTTPLAVMTLRLIGVGIDLFDGLSKDKKATDQPLRLHSLPSLLEMFGFCFCPLGLLVGPQFSFIDYKNYIEAKGISTLGTRECLISFLHAIFYLTLTIFCQSHINSSFLLSDDFQASSFIMKIFLIGLVGKVIMFKYFGVYLLQTTLAIYCQFTPTAGIYQRSNVDIFKFEQGRCIQNIVEGFNINTNLWAKYYIFKRMKFLGSKLLSTAVTLTFLAVWHGYHWGYFICFFLELTFSDAESRIKNWMKPLNSFINGQSPNMARAFRTLLGFFQWILMILVLGYALVSFDLLHPWKYNKVYSSVYYMGHWLPVLFAIIDLISSKKSK